MRLFIVVLLFFTSGCPTSGDARTIVDECTKTGTQCRMGGGKLGVCMMNVDGTFACTSQH